MEGIFNSILRSVGFPMGSPQTNGNVALAEVLDGTPEKSVTSDPMATESAEANGSKEGGEDYYGATPALHAFGQLLKWTACGKEKLETSSILSVNLLADS
jgi:hypothetical protein